MLLNRGVVLVVFRSMRYVCHYHSLVRGALIAALLAAPIPGSANTRDSRAAERVAFHLARAEAIHHELSPLVDRPCQRFPTRTAWENYLATRTDQGVTFSAHLDEAWLVAKTAGDSGLKARVEAARRRMLVGNPIQLVGKLLSCAWHNGTTLDAWSLWRRASAQATRRRQEVAREADLAIGRSTPRANEHGRTARIEQPAPSSNK